MTKGETIMNVQNEEQEVIHNSAYNAFPEPQADSDVDEKNSTES